MKRNIEMTFYCLNPVQTSNIYLLFVPTPPPKMWLAHYNIYSCFSLHILFFWVCLCCVFFSRRNLEIINNNILNGPFPTWTLWMYETSCVCHAACDCGARVWPAVRDDAGQGCEEVVLGHVLPVQHDAHAFGRHASHAVVVVAEQGHAHHRHAVVHGLVDTVEAAVAQEGPDVRVAYRAGWTRDIILPARCSLVFSWQVIYFGRLAFFRHYLQFTQQVGKRLPAQQYHVVVFHFNTSQIYTVVGVYGSFFNSDFKH